MQERQAAGEARRAEGFPGFKAGQQWRFYRRDLQKFLEICALTGTLVLDEKGVYDPRDFNDRLLLGLKWVMGWEVFMPCRRRRTPARKRETKLSRGKRRAGDAGLAPGLCGLRPPFPSRTAR